MAVDSWCLTAHHEAGHAIAATSLGYTVTEMCLHPEEGFTDFEVLPEDDDYTFILYAGPWAHARAAWKLPVIDVGTRDEDGLRFVDRVAAEMQANLSDWKKYERLMPDGDESAVDAAEIARTNAYYDAFEAFVPKDDADTFVFRYDPSAFDFKDIAQPKDNWACELAKLWSDTKALASHLLADDGVITFEHSALRRARKGYWFDPSKTAESFCPPGG